MTTIARALGLSIFLSSCLIFRVQGAPPASGPCEEGRPEVLECMRHPEYRGEQRVECNRKTDEHMQCMFQLRGKYPDLTPAARVKVMLTWHRSELGAVRAAKKVCDGSAEACEPEKKRLIEKRVKEVPMLIKEEEKLLKHGK